MENNCKWFFGSEGGIDIGPNDPIHQTFKGNPYYSIVREAIQNSLDAVNDVNNPVKVTFTYFNLKRSEFPNFFELENHINQSLQYFKKNNDANRLFIDMLHYLKRTEPDNEDSQISCLKISDYNTKGMYYKEGDTESPFYAFLRAAGVSAKMSGGAGGSFGFGKGAYFALSPIKTVIVSSKDNENNVTFEGATRLTTHIDESGKKITAYGYYDNNNGNPVISEEEIPDNFKRSEIGTDISIIGLWDENERVNLMIKSVLNNFWLSIHEKKLIVQIENHLINHDNLENVIYENFDSNFESGSATEIESWNPKPYFRAVKHVNEADKFKYFEEELKILGKVKLYIFLDKELPNRTSYFRMPKMVVFKKTSNKINGYAAVFICESKEGNEILRQMENPAHNEWKKENYPKNEGKINSKARDVEIEINKFINEKLDSLSKLNYSKKVIFLGLEEYLSIPEDLLESNDDSDISGENFSDNSGDLKNKMYKEETGLQTTDTDLISIKPTIKVQAALTGKMESTKLDNGEYEGPSGGVNNTEGGNDMGNNGGSKEKTNCGNLGKIFINVKYKVVAEKCNDGYIHHVIILTGQAIPNAEIELFASGDNDNNDGIKIVSSNEGIIEENKIKKLNINAGRNIIHVKFDDNIKHSLKIKTYEIQ